MSVEVGILGPVQLVSGGLPVPPTSAPARGVLAALALRPGVVVETDRALEQARRLQMRQAIQTALLLYGQIAARRGFPDEARRWLVSAVADAREVTGPVSLAGALTQLAAVEEQLGDLAAARDARDEAGRLMKKRP